jgi:hypothetical protein
MPSQACAAPISLPAWRLLSARILSSRGVTVLAVNSELDALVAEATVDCYNDGEQLTGLFTMIDEHLALPFETVMLGAPVTVTKVDLDSDDRIVARCVRDGAQQWISVLDLPLPSPAPGGAEWIAAYRHWRRGFAGE